AELARELGRPAIIAPNGAVVEIAPARRASRAYRDRPDAELARELGRPAIIAPNGAVVEIAPARRASRAY
ncbi:hypothetical protein CNY89_30295, partial [Amaricoccus sp. HAR-UPW-R2A-40]